MVELEADKIVFKPMSYEELSISLERLQRFNNPFRKLDRVQREILIKHLIFPKINLKNYYKFSLGTINFLTQLVWNESVLAINPNCKENYDINPYLFYEEIKEFSAKEILKRIVFSENISGYLKPANFSESDFICNENVLKDLFEQSGIQLETKWTALLTQNAVYSEIANNELNIGNKYSDINHIDSLSKTYISIRMNYPLNIDGFLQLAEKKACCEQRQEGKDLSREVPFMENQLNMQSDEAVSSGVTSSAHSRNNAKDISRNIKRLIWLNNEVKKNKLAFDFEKIYELAEIYRNNNCSKKPLKLLLLVEGATEEVLLPVFSSIAEIDFDKNGIEVVASGGKNQVARIYGEINQETNLPIFIILDADAHEIADEIKKGIRPQDRLYLISKGEFEDILPDKLICRAINLHYGLIGNIKKEELNINNRKVDTLINLWKEKGFGEFKKAEFAQIIAENIKSSDDLSEEMQKIISNIKQMILKG